MDYSKQTISSKSEIKRFSHQKRFIKALGLVKKLTPNSILDFGTGDGYFLVLLEQNLKTARLVGYEPLDFMFEQLTTTVKQHKLDGIEITDNLNTVDHKFDLVTCLEVMEHFSEDNQITHLKILKHLISTNGFVVISVPVEIGLSSLFKNLVRFKNKQLHNNSTFKNIIKSIFGFEVERSNDDYIYSHIGFNHKKLERLFNQCGFKIELKTFSPFPVFKGFINSQVFYVLKNKSLS
ncbi:MAG TPA: class I SAM-dependent methyltransferase [Flavobacteriaceae bacterium]|nr:class I SAM-dependent methyltransferase [Flavobacteriaceae bacterium]